MKLCRFNLDRLGLVTDGTVRDVTSVLDGLTPSHWVRAIEDPVIAGLPNLRSEIQTAAQTAEPQALDSVTLEAPVPHPSKIIGAPVNYHAHIEEALEDHALHQGRTVHPIDEIGCFLKAGSSLIGSGAVISIPTGADRVDYEGEVAVIIGKSAKDVRANDAMEHVAGFSVALDMSVRGKQDRSMRKSCDGFSVLGPALVTPDDVTDPHDIAFELYVNGDRRQAASTKLLIRSVPELIEICSAFYTLHPGDVIMTGTPAGVGPVYSGDQIAVTSPELGTLKAFIQ